MLAFGVEITVLKLLVSKSIDFGDALLLVNL
jgi:hypothetical protein